MENFFEHPIMLVYREGNTGNMFYFNTKLALQWQLEASRLVAFQGDIIVVLQTFGALEARVLLYSMNHNIHLLLLHLGNNKLCWLIMIWAVRAFSC